jgi:hypothetical protein
MIIVFVILYTIVLTFITAMFYFYGNINFGDFTSKNTIFFWVLYLTSIICFFLFAFYSPWNRALQKVTNDRKKQYDSLKENTEAVYQDQIKVFWVDALNKQNRYYLFTLMIITLLPFFYFLFYINTHTVPQIETFLNETFSFILLTISLFYTSLVLFIYTLCHEKIFMFLPFLLFLFLGIILYVQKQFPFLTTVGFICLCIIESVMILTKVAFQWCLIPLVPFYLTLFIMYTQKNSQLNR